MAISLVGNIVAENEKTSIDPWSGIAIGANHGSAGNTALARVATDNPSSTVGAQDSNFHLAITDSQGNTWTKIWERASSGNIDNATVCSLWRCYITSSLTTSHTLALDLSAAITAKAIVVDVFSGELDLVDYLYGDGAGVASLTIPSTGSFPSKEYLAYRAISQETTNATFNVTSGYTAGTVAGTTGSGGGTNQISKAEYLISTATSYTSAPAAGSSNAAWVFAVFEESAGGGTEHTVTITDGFDLSDEGSYELSTAVDPLYFTDEIIVELTPAGHHDAGVEDEFGLSDTIIVELAQVIEAGIDDEFGLTDEIIVQHILPQDLEAEVDDEFAMSDSIRVRLRRPIDFDAVGICCCYRRRFF